MKLKRTKKIVTRDDVQFPRSFGKNVGKVIEGSILDNIRNQKQASGAALKRNAPSTSERKRRSRRPQLSLVDIEHRFVKGKGASWKTKVKIRKQTIVITVEPATAELRRIKNHVENKGYTGWFGINKDAKAAIRTLFIKSLRRMLKRVLSSGGELKAGEKELFRV